MILLVVLWFFFCRVKDTRFRTISLGNGCEETRVMIVWDSPSFYLMPLLSKDYGIMFYCAFLLPTVNRALC